MTGQIIPADGLGTFERQKVHALTIIVKGNLPLMRKVHEGEEMEVVLTGTLSPATFKRKDGLLIREHTLVAEVAAEAEEKLAEEVTDFLLEVEAERRATLDSMEGQGTIEDALEEIVDPDEETPEDSGE